MAKRSKRKLSLKKTGGHRPGQRETILKLVDGVIKKKIESGFDPSESWEADIAKLEKYGKDYFSLLSKKLDKGSYQEQEVILKLLTEKKNPLVIDHLKEMLEGKFLAPRIKFSICRILQEKGEAIDAHILEEFKKAEEMVADLSRSLNNADTEKPEEKKRLQDKFCQASKMIKFSVLRQLIEEGRELNFSLLSEMITDGDIEVVEAIGSIVNSNSADFLNHLLQKTEKKGLRKVIKKSLYQLQSQGLSVKIEESYQVSSPALRGFPQSVSEAFVSRIDPTGDRLAILVKPKIPRGLTIFQALINDTKGIKEFSYFEASRKILKEYIAQTKEHNIEIVEITPPYFRFLVEEAYQAGMKADNAAPEDFVSWRKSLDPEKTDHPEPLIYQSGIDIDKIRENTFMLRRSSELLFTEYFAGIRNYIDF